MNNDNNEVEEQNQENEDMFQYFRIGGNLFQNNSNERANNNFIVNSRQSREQTLAEIKEKKESVTSKFTFAVFRLSILAFFYFLETNPISMLLVRLIEFLLIHDALVFANYIIMQLALLYYHVHNPQEPRFPSICVVFDTFINLVFFSWFIYGNLCILTDKRGVEESLRQNVLLTYYITVLILSGFFIFAKVIFYVIFFISFCPCLLYAFIADLRNDYLNSQRAKKIQQKLIPITYKEYVEKHGNENDICVICTDLFKEDDKIVCLPCSIKHVFHYECISAWIKKKTICPTCRAQLEPE